MNLNSPEIQLKDVCSFYRGVTYSKNDEINNASGIGILRSQNVDSENYRINFLDIKYVANDVRVKEEQRLIKNDILISIANSKELTGKCGFSFFNTNYYAGGFMAIIRSKEVIDPYYLFIILISENFKHFMLGKNQGTTSIWNITFNRIRDFVLPLPPLDEQLHIVQMFQNIEKSIIHAEEQEKNLSQLKFQLLRELFGEKKQFGRYLAKNDFEQKKFEKIAVNISEHVEPKQAKTGIYVGLEHLDTDDLIIRRKGKPEDVIGTKLKIYKGDIIFGKRRAYLRKVGVSDFDGIVSAHSMVLRANEQYIEKEFLPFFMQSDEFMTRAVHISEGSLSPTIKWKTLAQQEFILPKKEKQAKLVEVFKQIDEVKELIRLQKETLRKLKQKLLNEILGG
jgi:restriction endonuclease S subunit